MLSYLGIKNYAVIDTVEVELQMGLSVMTGETGAGKSILVDALGLVLGDRADAGTIRADAERAEVSAQFDCDPAAPALAWLREQGLDDGRECTLRRLITRDGRSKAFVNGQAVNLQSLRDLGSLLIDIHGQHAHQSLLSAATQRTMVDAHGGLQALGQQVADAFKAWRRLAEKLDSRRRGNETAAAELELLRFQLSELEALGLVPGEVAELDAEHLRLANVDRLQLGLNAAVSQLYDDDAASAFALIAAARLELEKLIEFDPDLAGSVRLLADAEIGLSEAASELARHRDRIDADPDRLAVVDERLARIRALARRHRVPAEELVVLQQSLAERCAELDQGGASLEQLEQQTDQARVNYFELAEKLSAKRRLSADTLAARVSQQLPDLGLPHGQFRIDLKPKAAAQGDATGLDQIEFLVTLNPGQPFAPLARVASGGELSRLSLALEVVSAGATQVPTLVFDEVDTGVSGGVAEMVGRRLRQIAADRQVLCVTHLPQVASQGHHHYRIAKKITGDVTRSDVVLLSQEERVDELSRMLGGLEITERARAHAAEMIARAAGSAA